MKDPQHQTNIVGTGNASHHHTPEEDKKIREASLDETIEATFPASDPPSTLPNPDDDDALERQNELGSKAEPPTSSGQ
jgi:hypothetical protein